MLCLHPSSISGMQLSNFMEVYAAFESLPFQMWLLLCLFSLITYIPPFLSADLPTQFLLITSLLLHSKADILAKCGHLPGRLSNHLTACNIGPFFIKCQLKYSIIALIDSWIGRLSNRSSVRTFAMMNY